MNRFATAPAHVESEGFSNGRRVHKPRILALGSKAEVVRVRYVVEKVKRLHLGAILLVVGVLVLGT